MLKLAVRAYFSNYFLIIWCIVVPQRIRDYWYKAYPRFQFKSSHVVYNVNVLIRVRIFGPSKTLTVVWWENVWQMYLKQSLVLLKVPINCFINPSSIWSDGRMIFSWLINILLTTYAFPIFIFSLGGPNF